MENQKILTKNISHILNSEIYNGEMIKKYRRILLSLVIIVIAIRWFYNGMFFYTDTHVPIYMDSYYQRMTNIWDFVSGQGDIRHMFLLPYVIFVKIAYNFAEIFTTDIQARIQIIESTIFLFNSFVIIIGLERLFYLLLLEIKIKPNNKNEILIGILTLFYLFNIWSITALWRPFWPYIFHYSFIPILIYSFLKCCENGSAKNYCLMLIVTIFISIGYTIPYSFIFDLLILLAISITIRNRGNVVKSSLLFIFYVVMVLFPIILTIAIYPSIIFAQAKSIVALAPIDKLLEYNSPDILKGFGVTGYPPFYNSHDFAWYVSTPYFSEVFYLVVFALFLLSPIILSRKVSHNVTILTMSVLYLIFLIFLSNSKAPFPFNIITVNILSQELFQPLRSVYVRFGEYIIISFILISFLSWSLISDRYKRVYLASMLIFFIVVQFPFLMSSYNLQAWENYDAKIPPIHTQIPSEYKRVLTDLELLSKKYDNIIIFPYPTSFQRMEWYQGPPLFALGSGGRVISDSDIRSNIISHIIDNTSPKLYAPYVIIYSKDVVPKDGNDIRLKRAFDNLLSIDEFSNKFDKIGVYNGSPKLFVYKESEFLSPFTVLNNIEMFNETVGKLFVIYQNKPVLIDYVLPTYYSVTLPKNILENFSSSVSFDIDIDKFRYDEIFVYPLFISYGTKGEKKAENLYIYLKFKVINDKELTIDIGNGKNWNYTKVNSVTINMTKRVTLDFLYDGGILINLTNGENITINSDDISAFNSDIMKISKNDKYNPLSEAQFRVANINLSDIFINKWFFTYKRLSRTPEDIYMGHNAELSYTTIVDYKKLNPTLWKVKIKSHKPFTLLFSENYDRFWVARVDKIDEKSTKAEKIYSTKLYSATNGFLINQTGNLEIIIEYEPQKWFNIGLVVSITTISIYIVYLIYNWRKRKNE